MFCFLHNVIHVSRSLLILDCQNAVLLMLLFLLMMMLMLLFVYFYYWILSGGPWNQEEKNIKIYFVCFPRPFTLGAFFGNRHLIFWRWLLLILSTSYKNRRNKFTNKLIINTFIDNLTSCVVFPRQLKSTQHSLHQRIYLIRGTQREYSSKPLKHSLFNVF